MTSHIFLHNIAIDMFQISQGKKISEKPDISPNCGFFQHFLALFDTFTTRCNHSGIKFKFFDYFYPYKHFILKSVLKMNQKCPSDLCAMVHGTLNIFLGIKLFCLSR